MRRGRKRIRLIEGERFNDFERSCQAIMDAGWDVHPESLVVMQYTLHNEVNFCFYMVATTYHSEKDLP